jgi:hypothetical protein
MFSTSLACRVGWIPDISIPCYSIVKFAALFSPTPGGGPRACFWMTENLKRRVGFCFTF